MTQSIADLKIKISVTIFPLSQYMNPNLAMVVGQGVDSAAKTFITVHLVDLVTGRVFFTAAHKRVLPPFHAVLSENWAVYTYFNDKVLMHINTGSSSVTNLHLFQCGSGKMTFN